MKDNVFISKYMPITLNMQIDIKSIFDSDSTVKLTNNIDYPKCSYGFHHYIHSLKKDVEILKQFENKKKVYLVTNQFEIEVDNYDKSINIVTNKFLDLKDKVPKIISLDFYKLWEILFMFDLFDINASNIKTIHLSDDGSTVQSLIHYREQYFKDSKSDKYYISNNLANTTINKQFVDYYDKKISQTDIDKIKDKIDLVIAGAAYTYQNDNENTIEQEYYKTLFSNIITCVRVIKKGGSFVCKFFETYTHMSCKFIALLVSMFDKVFFIKPMTSKPSTSEKYAVCIGFKSSDSASQSILKKLEKIEEVINKNTNKNICDLFNSYEIDHRLRVRLTQLNLLTSNKLFKSIGEIVNFVNSQNYYGDTYQDYRDKQIEANNFWTETFFPEPKDFKEAKKKITEASFVTNKINVDESIQLEKKITG